jgi:pimeloyl-ACP methyl ester carboxylesterase
MTPSGKILVRESEGPGRPILLVHGNSLNSEFFIPQIEGAPGRNHRVVAFDLPGHGGSDRARDPGAVYTLESYVRLLGEIIANLGLGVPVLVGHSLGGHIVLQAVAGGIEASGILVFGTPPLSGLGDLSRAFLPNPVTPILFSGPLSDSDAEVWASHVTRDRGNYYKLALRALRGTDPEARKVFGASLAPGIADEVRVLRDSSLPKAVGIGEQDPLVSAEYIRELELPGLRGGCPRIFPGAAHCPQIETPDIFNDFLLRLAAVTDGGPGS